MMLKILSLALVIVVAVSPLNAQDKSNGPGSSANSFRSYNTLHILNGSTTTSLAVNSVNGFQLGKFFTGIGVGFDYYYHVSVPVFAEARFDLVNKKGKLQLFANGGASIPFSTRNKNFETKTGDYKTGTLYTAGLDYLIPAKNNYFILGLAFSNKQIIQMVDNNIWNPVLNRLENEPIREEYSLNRIAMRIGWVF